MLSDEEILIQFASTRTRDQAFRSLIEKYQERVYGHIRKMVIDHDEADDLTQETFVKVWKNLDKFQAKSQLFTWIYRIATNECLQFLRKKRKRFFLPIHDLEGELSQKLTSSVSIDGDEVQYKLQKALLRLPDKQRLVFNMKYFEDMKYQEISEVLGTSVGALKASYHLAVKKIEAFLTEDN
ncbi:MAG: RNA polymerase sigma factor [Bacteroidota bacterium]